MYPDDISAGDWILIKSPVNAEEKWIGECGRNRRFPVCAEVHPSKEDHHACAGWYLKP